MNRRPINTPNSIRYNDAISDLQQMFPEMDIELINLMLEENEYRLESTVTILLQMQKEFISQIERFNSVPLNKSPDIPNMDKRDDEPISIMKTTSVSKEAQNFKKSKSTEINQLNNNTLQSSTPTNNKTSFGDKFKSKQIKIDWMNKIFTSTKKNTKSEKGYKSVRNNEDEDYK